VEHVIDVQDLRKTYRIGLFSRKSVHALRGASLQVRPGEIFGLLGPNGAGKTTLIKILLGIVRRTAGRAELLGFSAGDRRGRLQVGYLPEGHRLPRHLTGETALEYYGGLSGLSGKQIRARTPELLELVGLRRWGRTSVSKYSKGMLQRLGLAQAILHDPRLLVLDEPTDGVDPVGRNQIRNILKRLKEQGKSIFLNSHLLQELELVADRVAIMVGGVVRKFATVDELTASDGGDVEIEVIGVEDDVRAAAAAAASAAAASIRDLRPLVGNRCTFVVTSENPRQLNSVIDRLRQRRVDILRITSQRQTLEEVFMELVGSPSATDSPQQAGAVEEA
jgi:ABC-2 type transport system ATP-binding protein